MKKIVLLAVLLTSVTGYADAEWKGFGKGAGGVSFYYNTKLVSKTAKSVKLWTRLEKNGVESAPIQMEINCVGSKYRIVNAGDEWSKITPDSMMDILENMICKKK